MLIFGIDASLTNTAIVYGDGYHMQSAVFPSPSKQWAGREVSKRVARIANITKRVMSWIEPNLNKYQRRPAFIIESYAYNAKQGGEFLGELGGVLRLKLADCGPVYEVAPNTLKKFITGKGSGKKIGVVAAIAKEYEVQFEHDDEYDAFGLYLLGLVGLGIKPPQRQSQADAAEVVFKLNANVLPVRLDTPNKQSFLPF